MVSEQVPYAKMRRTAARLCRRRAARRRRKRATRPSSPSYLRVWSEPWQPSRRESEHRISSLLWMAISPPLERRELGYGFPAPQAASLRRGAEKGETETSNSAPFQTFGRGTLWCWATPDSGNRWSNGLFQGLLDTHKHYMPSNLCEPYPTDYKPYPCYTYKLHTTDHTPYTPGSCYHYSQDDYKPYTFDSYNLDNTEPYTADSPFKQCTTQNTIDQAPPTIHLPTRGLGDTITLARYLDIVTSIPKFSHTPEVVAQSCPKQHLVISQTQTQQQQRQQQQRLRDQGTESSQEHQTQLQTSALFQAFRALALLALHNQCLSIRQCTSPKIHLTYLQWSSSLSAPSMRLLLV
ncbi:unnamed protein product [Tuber melanosporum]|uniref:(Perigord truffle) hypothetical protein n=1 Tax=Tuber melanosporum (strain Mel28) TaxID=656061 RepID=D5G5L7_TUBMM|nr:uncharacterized protein GSTUM_00000373001 [Tuber melanosporum]CAZ79810.1 unnamed protein product [Tuber melanosporum]